MPEALRLLSELTADDISWILEKGTEIQVISETLLIREGEPSKAIWIVLDGLVGVTVAAAGSQLVARLGPGEMMGEISFLDGRPATASVKAVENSLLLELPRSVLEERLTDSAFAARFYRACAMVVSPTARERGGRRRSVEGQALAGGRFGRGLVADRRAHRAHEGPAQARRP
jgi:CRP-like cAMP-binding protein